MYDVFDAMGAVWGQQYGLEVVNYFAEGRAALRDAVLPPLQRLGGDRARGGAVREGVGINEVQNFGKYDVQGPGCARLARPDHGGPHAAAGAPVAVAHAVAVGADHRGFHRLLPRRDRIPLTASYGAQDFHMRWFDQHMEDGVSRSRTSRTGARGSRSRGRARAIFCRM
jgi:dimethylglycine dehydrogenase